MLQEAHPLRDEVLAALRNLRHPAGLRASPLLDCPAVRDNLLCPHPHPSPDNLALAMRTRLEAIIEELRPGSDEDLTQRDWLRYYVLHYLFRRGDSARSAQRILGISRSYLYELRNEAVDSVATLLVAAAPQLQPVPHNLPLQPTPFVGREDELAEINQLLEDPACRLLTLVGTGGIGKTRLALQAALQAATKGTVFSDGVYFVPLAPLSSAGFLVSAVANSLGFSFQGNTDPKEQLLNYLREKEVLLLLDNFEHLLEGTGLLVDMLGSVPGVKLLVTSRERLNLHWEWPLEVQGLTFPQNGQVAALEDYSAVQLFLQSARRIHPRLSISEGEKLFIVRICQSLEGVPLGIELAAAWVQTLSCQEIAQEIERNLDLLSTSLRDMPERQRSMRATFDHSWYLLSEGERSVFRKLSVFRGGFRTEAAEMVAGASPSLLSALVHKSFLRETVAGWYETLEILRQYAEEKLGRNSQERDRAHDLHCEYYAEFLRQREEHLKGEKQKEALEEIGEEIENVRAGWHWAATYGKGKEIEKSLESLCRFHEIRGWLREGEEALARAVEGLGGMAAVMDDHKEERDIVLGKLLARKGWFYFRLSRFEEAEELLQASLSIFYQLGARKDLAFSLNVLGSVAEKVGRYTEARQLFRESLAICRELGDRWGMAGCLNNLGNVAGEAGEYTEARQLYQESLAICRELGNQREIAIRITNLGVLAETEGEYREARRLHQEAIAIFREVGDRLGVMCCLNNLGFAFCALGECQEAGKCFRETLEMGMAGDVQVISWTLEALVGMATLLTREGKKGEQAVELAAHCLHHPGLHMEARGKAEQLLSELEIQLPPQAFTAACERGKAKELEHLVWVYGGEAKEQE